MSAGYYHSALLRSDGLVVSTKADKAFSFRDGVTCVQVSAAEGWAVMLLSSGEVVVVKDGSDVVVTLEDWVTKHPGFPSSLEDGSEDDQEQVCRLPPLEDGVTYVQISAGRMHVVLLCSDGHVVACGDNRQGQCSIPELEAGVTYVQVSAGGGNAVGECSHTVLLRSDGIAVACGYKVDRMFSKVSDTTAYAQVSTGEDHVVLLRTDGGVDAFMRTGSRKDRRCRIPALDSGLAYVQVSAGGRHTALLRSDGWVVCCGDNEDGQCDIPPLREGVTYVQVSAGGDHTLLLRSDGSAVAVGEKSLGERDVPDPGDFTYVAFPEEHATKVIRERIVQLSFESSTAGHVSMRGFDLSGEMAVCLDMKAYATASDVLERLAAALAVHRPLLRGVLPDGHLLNAEPAAKTIGAIAGLEQALWATS